MSHGGKGDPFENHGYKGRLRPPPQWGWDSLPRSLMRGNKEGMRNMQQRRGWGGGEDTRVSLLPQSHVDGSSRKLGTYPKDRWKTRLYYQTTKIRGS